MTTPEPSLYPPEFEELGDDYYNTIEDLENEKKKLYEELERIEKRLNEINDEIRSLT